MKRTGRISYHLCRLLLGGVFVWAGAVKALDVPAFAGQVATYQLLPYAWNYAVAATLPFVELLAGGRTRLCSPSDNVTGYPSC